MYWKKIKNPLYRGCVLGLIRFLYIIAGASLLIIFGFILTGALWIIMQ